VIVRGVRDADQRLLAEGPVQSLPIDAGARPAAVKNDDVAAPVAVEVVDANRLGNAFFP